MSSLRKLGNGGTKSMKRLPEGIGGLTNLQRLDSFMVAKDESGSSNVEELKELNNLFGELTIENLDVVGTKEEVVTARLELKRCLTCLRLYWLRCSDVGEHDKKPESTISNAVLQALCPPFQSPWSGHYGFPGSKRPTWLGLSTFCGLHRLFLYNCFGSNDLSALGSLLELRELSITEMPTVKKLTLMCLASCMASPNWSASFLKTWGSESGNHLLLPLKMMMVVVLEKKWSSPSPVSAFLTFPNVPSCAHCRQFSVDRSEKLQLGSSWTWVIGSGVSQSMSRTFPIVRQSG